ncbi:hypothetical protein [Ruminococcus sp.]|uniref:hypothetical protein n=1 Tax=Ruminococcus sp. TaxID=41978 RepID=UPI0025E81D5B|nr:hypothetical protein [Ruminococcus sp.]
MKRFTIIGGLDCVGKSSFTGVLVRKTDDLGLIIDTDKLNAEFDGDRRYEKRFSDLAAVLPYCSEAEFWDNENGFVNVANTKMAIL